MNQYIIDEETWLRVEYFLRYLYELNDSTCDKEWIDNIISIVHSNPYNPQADRDKVLDIGAILESLCNVDLYWYSRGSCESDDVGKCRGKGCNYCGRYSEELPTPTPEERP